MTNKATRKRSDSTQARVEAMKAAADAQIGAPQGVSLRPCDQSFWKAITEARPRSTWTGVDLFHAANLARTMADIELLQSAVDSDGLIVENKINPAAELLEKLSRRAMSLSRMIHVHTLATVGRSGDAAGLAALERDARAQHHEDDGLIPKGPVQ